MTGKDTPDLAQAERHIRITGSLASAVTGGAFAAAYLIWAPLDAGAGLEDRLRFALGWGLLPLLILMSGVGWVAGVRRRSEDDVRGAAAGPPSPRLALSAAFLQNTLEQAVIALGAYLALAVLSDGPLTGLIAPAAMLFVTGRVLFAARYRAAPVGRALGMHLTLLPSMVLYGFCLWLAARHAFG